MAGILAFTLKLANGQFTGATIESANEVDKFSKKVNNAGNEVKKMEGHGHSVRHVRHELSLLSEAAGTLGADFGRLGSLAGLMFSPYTLAIGGMVMAVDMLNERWKKNIETQAKVIEQTMRFRNVIAESLGEAMNRATLANAEFHNSLDHMGDATDRESQAMERRIELFRETVASQNQVWEAQRRATDAQIDANEALGRYTPLQALSAHQANEMTTRARGNESDNRAAQEAIDEKTRRLATAKQELREATADHDRVVNGSQRTEASIETAQFKVESAKADRDQALKDAAEAKAKFNAWNNGDVNIGETFSHPVEANKAAQARAKAAQDDVIQAEKHLAQLQAQKTANDAEVNQFAEKARQNRAIVNTAPGEIQQARAELGEKKKAQREELLAMAREFDARRTQRQMAAMPAVMSAFAPTSIERMGFSFGRGGPTHLGDHQASISRNTQDMVGLMRQLLDHLGGRAPTQQQIDALFTNQIP